METEEDYKRFLISLYGKNISPVFEQLFYDLIKEDCEFLDFEETDKCLKNINSFNSEGDLGYRHSVIYGNIFMTPINDNKEFFIHNESSTDNIYVTYTTNNCQQIYYLMPKQWKWIGNCEKFVQIKTSEMPNNLIYNFDLNLPCHFKLEPD